MRVEDVLNKFPTAPKRSGKWYLVKCPLHKDDVESMSMCDVSYLDKHGNLHNTINVKCFAGCDGKAIKSWLKSGSQYIHESNAVKVRKPAALAKIVATYPYYDFAGKLAYEVVRYEPKQFNHRRFYNGNYVWGITEGHYYQSKNGQWYKCKDDIKEYKKVKHFSEVNPMLYNFKDVMAGLKINPQARLFIVGGEKDVETLKHHKFLATTNSGGEGKDKWRSEFSEALAHINVVFIPDNDLTGYEHLYRVAESIIPHAASFKVIELPCLKKEHEDVSDWFTNYGGTAEWLKKLVTVAKDYKNNAQEVRNDFKFSLNRDSSVTVEEYIEALSAEADNLSMTMDISKLGLCFDCEGTGYQLQKDADGFSTFLAETHDEYVVPKKCPCAISAPELSDF